jgi:hypothetical protein
VVVVIAVVVVAVVVVVVVDSDGGCNSSSSSSSNSIRSNSIFQFLCLQTFAFLCPTRADFTNVSQLREGTLRHLSPYNMRFKTKSSY